MHTHTTKPSYGTVIGYDEVGLGDVLERISTERVITCKRFQLAHEMGALKYKAT